MFWKAAKTSILLSLLFVVVYGACNRITALREDVGTFYFEWERRIPFVEAMIVPYLSIDLFFVIAPFLCASERELQTYRRRIVGGILIAGVFFLLFPLKFTFPRPEVPGVLGLVFNQFRKMDLPYNEFPSLHIALRAVLIGVYVRHARGWARWALHIWFSLIGLSTVLVYQHHVIDIAGGFVLAGVVYSLFREQELPHMRNVRVGWYYLAGAGVLLGVALWSRTIWSAPTWGILLLWPMSSLAMVGAAYFGVGPGIYRKFDGRVGRWSWLVLWPVMLGQRISLWHYARRCRAWDRLTKRVWIGRRLSEAAAREAVGEGVTAVVDLCEEFSEADCFRSLKYLQVPILDLTAPTREQMRCAVEFIERESRSGIVYVHCKVGYSRTGAVAGAYLLSSGLAGSVEEAVALLRVARPSIILRREAMAALGDFEKLGAKVANGETRTT